MVQPRLPLFGTAVGHYALAVSLLGGVPGTSALAAFPPDPCLSMQNTAFAAGHGGRGPVETPTQPFRGNGSAPKTWSSRPGCAQEGRFTGMTVPEARVLLVRRRECFGGQSPCHLDAAVRARQIGQLSTRLPRIGRSRASKPGTPNDRIDSPACGGTLGANASKTAHLRYNESNSGRWFL